MVPPESNMKGSVRVTAVITDDQVRVIFNQKLKYDPAFAADRMKAYQKELARINRLPEDAGKQDQLKRLNDYLNEVMIYTAGVVCSTTTLAPYTFDGSTLRTSKATVQSSTCPGTPDSTEGGETKVELNGDLLTISTLDPADSVGACPEGDRIIMMFSRVK